MNIRKLLLMLSLFYSAISFAQVGVGTATPNSSTMLDVVADDKGVLLPRVQLNNSTDATTIVPQNEVGLMVYNVAAMADIGVGYHFWDGAKWVAMRTEGLTSGTGDPNGNGTTGEAGDIYVDESTGDIYVHDGNTWINSVEANETISTLTDNGDGTYTYEDEEGTQTTFDVNNPEITDNGDGTYTVTNADGTTSTIDTNATTGYVTDGTIDIDDDGTPDNNVTIQQALEALAAQASIVSTLTDNGDGTYTYEDEEGTQTTFSGTDDQKVETFSIDDASAVISLGIEDDGETDKTIDLTNAIAANETDTSLAQNTSTGVITYTAEDGLADTANVVSGATGNIVTVGADGGSFLNQAAIAANETDTSLAQDTSTGVITYTAEDGLADTANVVSGDADNLINVGTDGGAYIDQADLNEPWFGTDNNAAATTNTEDMYVMGNIGVGTSTLSTGKVATFAGDVDIQGVLDPTKIIFSGDGSVGSFNPTTNNAYEIEFDDKDLRFTNSTKENNLVIAQNGNVGVGHSTPQTNLHVQSSTDNPMYISNTNNSKWNRILFQKPAQVWTSGQDSGNDFMIGNETLGLIAMRVTGSKNNVGFGGAGAARSDTKMYIENRDNDIGVYTIHNENEHATGPSSSNKIGGFTNLRHAAQDNTGVLYAKVNRVSQSGTSFNGNMNKAYGSLNDVVMNGGGAITDAYGVGGAIEANGNGGSITNAYAGYFKVSTTLFGGSPSQITNGYGAYIDDIDTANKWAFYSEQSDTPSYFAGRVAVGNDDTPDAKLDVYNEDPSNMPTAILESSAPENVIEIKSSTETWYILQDVHTDGRSRLRITNKTLQDSGASAPFTIMDDGSVGINDEGPGSVANPGGTELKAPSTGIKKLFLSLNGLVIASDNADAISKGVGQGDVYRNSNGQLFVRY